jgi:peptide deformylase
MITNQVIEMSLLEILPDTSPLMKKTSRKVTHVDSQLRKLVEDMYETMVENWGIGLAAVQVGALKRLFIYEIPKREIKGYETCRPDNGEAKENESVSASSGEIKSEDIGQSGEPVLSAAEEDEEEDAGYTGEYLVCINPKIIVREGSIIDDEGCLSKSGWMAKVERAYKITFHAYDLEMQKFERTVTGLEARCVQHEIDHMDGILFTDRAQPGTLREVTDEEENAEESSENSEKNVVAEPVKEDTSVGTE